MEPNTSAVRLLVVDDSAIHRRGMARYLRHAGYEVDDAESAALAMRRLEAETYDAVLTDIAMPGLSGIDLLRAIRKRDREVPVILVTGEPALETAIRAMEHGANHYLIKPARVEEILAVVKRLVQLGKMARVRRDAEAVVRDAGIPLDRYRLQQTFARCLDTLWMAFQPIVRVSDGSIAGYEALMRSREPELAHPPAVVDAAQSLNQLHDLGRIVRALAATPFINASSDSLLFVNVHPGDLADPTLTITGSPLSRIARQVVLEVTERASLEHALNVREQITRLRKLGFRIAIDDIGAGYAGLSTFAFLEPEFVKVDMSLVRGIEHTETKQRVVRSLLDLCREMNIQVVAEGVETMAEKETLMGLGSELMQGFLFARPGPAFPAVTRNETALAG